MTNAMTSDRGRRISLCEKTRADTTERRDMQA
jgi:hypothetical protein